MAFAIVMPPLQVNDEDGHFIRAYLISRGEIIGRGIPALPAPVVSFVMRYPEFSPLVHKFTSQEIARDLPSHRSDEGAGSETLPEDDPHHKSLIWSFIGSGVYCPLVYMPASTGIWMARSLHASPLAMMYAARAFNVLAFVCALAVSLRLAPGYRAVLIAVAVMPMTLQSVGGVSADSVTIAFSFLALSLVLYAREHLVNRRFLILVAFAFVICSLCKFGIWSFPLLWLVPGPAFKDRRSRLAYIGITVICMAGALLFWNGVTSANVEALRAARLSRGIDISANLRIAANHPLDFAGQLLALGRSGYRSELRQFVGAFGWTQTSLPLWVGAGYLCLLVLVAATEMPTRRFLLWERGVLLLVSLSGAILIHVVILLFDGAPCAENARRLCFVSGTTAGVQGRYLIPMCIAGLLALRQDGVNLSQPKLLALVTGAGTLHALAALALIRRTFYW